MADENIDKQRHQQLLDLQALSLDRKIQLTQSRIMEWYNAWDNKCYVSFSGGKDSTVLADITAQVNKILNCKLVLWFSDTGLEYPEVRDHVQKFAEYLRKKYEIEVEVISEFPTDRNGNRITFRKVIEKYGYPIISKNVAYNVYYYRSARDKGTLATSKIAQRMNGEYYNPRSGTKSPFNCEQWKFLVDAPFQISDRCCSAMKKRPAHRFEKRTGLKPIIGTMTVESKERKKQWILHGCNAFDGQRPSSKPLSFWKEEDILTYIEQYQLPIPSVYGEIKVDENGKHYTTGCDRTGCVYCAFGAHLQKEPNKFQMLKETHPKLYEYCMRPWDEGGLGMDTVLDYINVKH